MTVYVDDFNVKYKPNHRHKPGLTYIMSHMIADTEEELHQMADKIGVARKWYQGDHYDISQTKKKYAIKYGAVLIPVRTLAFMAINRRAGYPMGTPETAEQIAKQRIAARG